MTFTSSSSASFFTRTVVLSLATLLAAYLLPGVTVSSVWAAIGTAIVIALLDNFVRPILIVITLPVTVLSLGLFIFIINAIIIEIASGIVPGFSVASFGNALIFSIILTIFNYLLELPNKYLNRKNYEDRNDNQPNNNDDHFDDYEEIK